MFGHLSIGLDAGQRMSAGVQIQDEAVKNYAELAGRHSSAHRRTAEESCNHGDACEPTGSQNLATLPPISYFGKRKPENQNAEISTFA